MARSRSTETALAAASSRSRVTDASCAWTRAWRSGSPSPRASKEAARFTSAKADSRAARSAAGPARARPWWPAASAKRRRVDLGRAVDAARPALCAPAHVHPPATRAAMLSRATARARISFPRFFSSSARAFASALRQLGLAQAVLDPRQVRREPRDDRPGIARTVAGLDGQAGLRQGQEVGVGAARVQPAQRVGRVAPRGLDRQLLARPADVGGTAGEDLAEDRAQAEDVGPLVDGLALPARLLRRHVGRGPHHRPGPRGVDRRAAPRRADRSRPRAIGDGPRLVGRAPRREDLGQAPVHHLHLAEIADHDVRGLQVAVDHAPGMGIGHRLADILEDPQEPGQLVGRPHAVAQLRRQRPAPHELHREVGPLVGEHAQLVDRHHARVLELAADGLRLLDEPEGSARGRRACVSSSTLTARSRRRSGSRPLSTAPIPPRAISPSIS